MTYIDTIHTGDKLGCTTLYNADCMDIMRGMPDNAFDLAIVDPPYGIAISKFTTFGKKRQNKALTQYQNKDWDCKTPPVEYFEELYRVSKNVIIWGANYFLDKVILHNHSWIVWDKKQPEGISFAMAELASCPRSGPIQVFRHLHDGNRVSNNSRKASIKIHPTQKPVALYKWLLAKFAKPGDCILDTHLGSGSSAIAAYDGGFEFVGIELDTDYYAAAKERIINHQSQGKLFRHE